MGEEEAPSFSWPTIRGARVSKPLTMSSNESCPTQSHTPPLQTDPSDDLNDPASQEEDLQTPHHGGASGSGSDDSGDGSVDIPEHLATHETNGGSSSAVAGASSGGSNSNQNQGGASSSNANNGFLGAATSFLNGSTAANLFMTNPPAFDEEDFSTPWLDYLHSFTSQRDQQLPFGLQLAPDSGTSESNTFDHEMSDSDDGGASLGEHILPAGEPLLTVHGHNLATDDDDFSAAEQDTHANEPLDAEMQDGGSIMNAGGAVPLGSGLPFGFLPELIPPDPPDPWIPLDDAPSPFAEPLPQAPMFLPHILTVDDLPLLTSMTNHSILGSNNVNVWQFLQLWAERGAPPNTQTRSPDIRRVMEQADKNIEQVLYSDLEGDKCDFQGLDWEDMGTTRRAARAGRLSTYRNYVNREGSDFWTPQRLDTLISPSENYFRFRKTNIRRDVKIEHFQLRSVLACPSRSQAFYPSSRGINRLNPIANSTDLAVDLSDLPAYGRTITTLDTACGVLVGGTYNGDYIAKSVYSEDPQAYTEGRITGAMSGITNHLQVHAPRRSTSPVAAIASNDMRFRVLDLQSEKFMLELKYNFHVNCSAISPDRRLRVLVGDAKDVAITNAETGHLEVELEGHRDYGFACAWSDDGWTVATGFQDRSIKIWDARKWKNSAGHAKPVKSIWCDMAGARSLRFSPVGSGPPVLVAAEEADYVNVIDAKTFKRKQTLDLFGEIAGISFANEGQQLNVLVSDAHRGGLMQFERDDLSAGTRRAEMLAPLHVF